MVYHSDVFNKLTIPISQVFQYKNPIQESPFFERGLNYQIKLSEFPFRQNTPGKWFDTGPKYSGEEVIQSYDRVLREQFATFFELVIGIQTQIFFLCCKGYTEILLFNSCGSISV